ncbi:MAG: hypothetical protein KC478_06360, partial [Bacteriovoracaceae bacterium]|nr:hypothetical protein [Bacteriovoracaceae bacterium]
GNSKAIKEEEFIGIFKDLRGVEVTDLHLWRIAPNANACELVVYNNQPLGTEFYRKLILEHFDIQHLIVEERICEH